MKFDARLKKLESAINDIRTTTAGYRVVSQKKGQSESEALAGLEASSSARIIFIRKFSSGELETPETIDAEINRLTVELKQEEGLTDEEISQLLFSEEELVEAMAKQAKETQPETEQNQMVNAEAGSAEADNGLLKVKPIKSDLARF